MNTRVIAGRLFGMIILNVEFGTEKFNIQNSTFKINNYICAHIRPTSDEKRACCPDFQLFKI